MGAFDFVEKPFDGQELVDAARDALNVGKEITGREEARSRVQDQMKMLTERERQVLELVLEGEPNKRIAYSLGISQKTVEFHRANLKSKLDARSTADLIRKVVAAGHS
jgi:RNA polymerase sigma factor (sigma-70 family)